MMDLLDYFPCGAHDKIRAVRTERQAWLGQEKKGFLRYRLPCESVASLRASSCDFSGDVVRIGSAADLSAGERQHVQEVLHNFMPWRKGPFSVFDIEIDAEWRSERKWNRLLPVLPSLRDKIIADIGCNNGYYMFRMAHYRPALVLGFEPFVQHHYIFKTLNTFAAQENLVSEPLGVEHLPLFPDSFDVIFLMGIIYHRPSPVNTLKDIFTALKPGGCLLLESQAIPGNEPVALFPEQTYAKVPGTWFVPTGSCLRNWLARTGFKEIDLFCSHPMSSAEQRKTEWMVFESYEDFIDKNRSDFTIEGYPAPWRVFLKAVKP